MGPFQTNVGTIGFAANVCFTGIRMMIKEEVTHLLSMYSISWREIA